MSRRYPDCFANICYNDSTPLRDITIMQLEVDTLGNVANPPDPNSGKDFFAILKRKGDLNCLLKPLPYKVLRQFADSRKVQVNDTLTVTKARDSRDDVIHYSRGGSKRSTYIYGTHHLLGKNLGTEGSEVTPKMVEAFISDLGRFVKCRPNVGHVASNLLSEFVEHRSEIRHDRIPLGALKSFWAHGRGGNFDSKIIGTLDYDEVKIDQKMSYLSRMKHLDATEENVAKNILWLNEDDTSVKYDPYDAYGIYCIDGYVDETLLDTPIYKVVNEVLVPIVGPFKDVVVLKPVMDDIKLLESLGRAKITNIKWFWRFKGLGKRPFRVLCDKMSLVKSLSKDSSAFWKLVACAIWGKSLETYNVDVDGKPLLQGGYWFNPVIGYTTTAMMNSYNFRTKLFAKGLISAEVVDALIGKKDFPFDEDVYKIKDGCGKYTHLNLQLHVSQGDDKFDLLNALDQCRTSISVPYRTTKTRTMFDIFDYCGSEAQELFGNMRDRKVLIPLINHRRKPAKGMKGIPPRELLHTYVNYSPYTEEQAGEFVSQDFDSNLFELLDEDLTIHNRGLT